MKKYMLSLAVLVVAVAATAFTKAPAEEAAVAVQYQFIGTNMNDVYNTNLWTAVSGSGPACSGEDLPCVVSVQSGSIGTWLNARDHAQILEDAQTLKD